MLSSTATQAESRKILATTPSGDDVGELEGVETPNKRPRFELNVCPN